MFCNTALSSAEQRTRAFSSLQDEFHYCVPILSSHENKRTVLICNSMILFDFLSRYRFSHYDSLDNHYFCIYIIWYSFNCLKKELEAYRYFRSSIKNNLKMCVSVCACMCARMPRVYRCLWRPEEEAGCSEDGIMEWSWATHPTRMLETEPGSSEGAENAPNGGAILQPLSPVLTYFHI